MAKSELRRDLSKFRMRYLVRRPGHVPGDSDVSITTPGELFKVRPNFYWLHRNPATGERRPFWLPIFPQPRLNLELGQTINAHWPLEGWGKLGGDWIEVVGQVHGETLTNEIGESSDVWNVVLVAEDWRYARLQFMYPYRLVILKGQSHRIGYVSDLWCGHTGWHGPRGQQAWYMPGLELSSPE